MLVGILMKWMLHHAGDHQGLSVAVPERSHQITVHLADELEGNLLRTHHGTLTMIRAAAEALVGHRSYHADGPLIALGLTLRQRIEVSKFRGGKKHRAGVGTGGDAR